MNRIAVYGTLRKGEGNYRGLLEGRSTYIGTDLVPGTLYHLGGFPGAIFDEQGWITVDIFDVEDDVLKDIDRLEGYDPDEEDHWFYRRVPITTGKGVSVESYEYMGHVRNDMIIMDGDWLS